MRALPALRSAATFFAALPRRLLLALVWIYRTFVSPVLPPACRYYPSCSQYAAEALAMHGAIKGAGLAGWRLLRCHPYAVGGPDPVPPRAPRKSLQSAQAGRGAR